MPNRVHGSAHPCSVASGAGKKLGNGRSTSADDTPGSGVSADSRVAASDTGWSVGLCLNRPDLRPRIRPSDARLVRSRVEQRAAELNIRCASLRALQGVLTLLLDHNVIRDVRVRLHHVMQRFPAGTRFVAYKTLGRVLAQLQQDGLIVYRPAQGRGCYAGLAIHPDFLDGICELQRDAKGRVIADLSAEIVTFSTARFLIGDLSPTTPKPPAADVPADKPLTTRPTEVTVDPKAITAVLTAIPECYRTVPGRVRGAIAKEIGAFLARGWLPEQVTEILAATLPKTPIQRPLQLVRWRLGHNMLGAGPRLEPLQRRWESDQAALERTRHANQLAASYQRVIGEIGAAMADRIIAEQPGAAAGMDPAEHRHRRVVGAARVARREYPGWPLDAAINAWLTAQRVAAEPPPPLPTHGSLDGMLTAADLLAITPSGRCLLCGSIGAVTREELPLKHPVCDDCWDAPASPTALRDEITGIGHRHDEPDQARWEAC